MDGRVEHKDGIELLLRRDVAGGWRGAVARVKPDPRNRRS